MQVQCKTLSAGIHVRFEQTGELRGPQLVVQTVQIECGGPQPPAAAVSGDARIAGEAAGFTEVGL